MKINLPGYLFFTVLFFWSLNLLAQKNEKPKILIYGSTVASFAAAVQCAQSDVSVVWILEGNDLIINLPNNSFSVDQPSNLSSGVWMDLLMLMGTEPQPKDSVAELVNKNMTTQIFKNSLDALCLKQKKLTIIRNTTIKQITKSKNGWTATLPNQKIEVLSIFDGTADFKLSGFIEQNLLLKPISLKSIGAIGQNEIRTLVASGYLDDDILGVKFSDVQSSQMNGFYQLKSFPQVTGSISDFPFMSSLGQAIGATMAYTAFFKTTIDKVNIRILQGELLKFRSRLMPYQDVLMEDKNFQNIQKFGLSGIIMGTYDSGKYVLDRYASVNTEEVKSPILKFFSRAQLWYRENSDTMFKSDSFFSLIKMISFKDANTIAARDQQLDKDQHASSLTIEDQNVGRYDFASYFEAYCKSFDVSITLEGMIQR